MGKIAFKQSFHSIWAFSSCWLLETISDTETRKKLVLEQTRLHHFVVRCGFENHADKGFSLLGLKAEFDSPTSLRSEGYFDSEGKVIVRDLHPLVNPAYRDCRTLFWAIKTDCNLVRLSHF